LQKQLWLDYVNNNQTLSALSAKYGISTITIRRKLDDIDVKIPHYDVGNCVIVMDTCYFGRGFGLMVFRDSFLHKNILWYYVKYETVQQYIKGINNLKNQGYIIQGIVCDGRKGLFMAFGSIPVQICQFHQMTIITRYITRNPNLLSGIELKAIVNPLCKSNHHEFSDLISKWESKCSGFLK